MRRSTLTISLACSLLLMTGSAGAEPFIPKMHVPESYKDFRFGLDEMRQNIDTVECGGWDPNTGAVVNGASASGFIPTPDISPDIPGRRNVDPMGDVKTGVGTRGDFEYPDSAWGYVSPCDVVNGQVYDPDLAAKNIDVKWNLENGDDPSRVTVTFYTVKGSGMIDVNPAWWCTRRNDFDKSTPQWCKKLFEVLTNELSPFLHALNITPNPLCPEPPKTYCVDPGYTKECHGQECRTLEYPGFYNKLTECHAEAGGKVIVDVPGGTSAVPSSFYRHYAQSFMNPAISVQGGGKTWQVRSECYEYYKEVDPKEKVTSGQDEQCEFVISTPDEQNPDKPEWPEEGVRDQKLPKTRTDGPAVSADRSAVEEPARDSRDIPEPWVADTETNLNMIDMNRLQELQADFEDPSDITFILGTLLPSKQRASKAIPKNARTDAVDDSDDRAFVLYWEAQQRELLNMTADPRTQIILPARFLVGIDENDPLFQYVTQKIVRPNGTVELTLRAGPEDLRNVILSLQRMFIAPLQEVRIPVLVPLASDLEINSLIFQWEQWKKYEDQDAAAASRAPKSGEADPLIEKLRQYQTRIEQVRRMRGSLANTLKRMYDGQEEIREYFASWFKEQTDQFLLAIEHAEQRRELRRIWRLLQRSLLQTDACQIYWCGNQRYSAPVYSLLDQWWGKNAPGENRDPDYALGTDDRFDPPLDLARLNYTQPEDTVFDFSDMKFPREPLLLPVLWPVQVKVRLPSPPDIGGKPPSTDDFPDLLALPDENIFDSFDIPEVDLGDKPTVALPPTPDLESAKTILREIRRVVDGTQIPDQIAQEEALKVGDSIDQGDLPSPGEVLSRDNLMHTYCRFQPSIIIPPDPEGKKGDPMKIIHVENDLRERLARLFVRWMPERMEDYAGRVARLNQDYPNPDAKPACHEDVLCYFLPPEKTTVNTWQWFMPKANDGTFDDLANQLRDMTLPNVPVDDRSKPSQARYNPYENATYNTLQRLFPKIALPLEYQLYPDSSTP